MPKARRPSAPRRDVRELIHQAVLRVDALEPRRLLSASLDDDGLLTVNGTNGDDTISIDRSGGDLIVTLNGDEDGSFKRKDVQAIVVNGLDGRDALRIGANVIGTTLNGGNAEDTLLGGEGDDVLDGGAGNDSLDGKEGSDLLIGGAGLDSADYRFETADLTLSIDGVANEEGGNAAGDNISLDVERVVGGSGSDFITGSDADNSVTGRRGDDTIWGGGGSDSIDGDEGDDSLAGEVGNDVLTGGDGRDSMTGGAGDDSFIADDGQADTIDGGGGTDNAVADQPGDTVSNVEAGVNIPAPEITVTVGGTTLTDNFSTVNFGSVGQGKTGPTRTFTVKNDGDDVLSVGAVSVPAGFIVTDPLVGPIQPGQSESFTVQVDTSVAGGKGGDATFANSDADENPFNFTITATVDPAPPQIPDVGVRLGAGGGGADIADGSTGAIDFGSVNQNAAGPTRTFTVRNDGSGPLTIGAVSVPAGFTVIDGLSGPIAPGGTESFTVRMDTGTAGGKGGDVVITTNDPDEDPFNFAIAGTVAAVAPPTPEITVTLARPAGPIDNGNSTTEFGTRAVGGRGATRTFRVRNDGKAPLTIGAVTVPAGFTIIDPLVGPIAPGETESFVVQMETASAGVKLGTVTIANNDPNEAPFTFRITGTIGVNSTPSPEVTVNVIQNRQLRGVLDGQSSFKFGTAVANGKLSRTARTFRVLNDGNATLTIGKVSVPAGFVVLDGLGSSLAPGQTDNLVVAVDSRTPLGNKSGQISFATNDASENPFSFGVSGAVAAGAPGGRPEISVLVTNGQVIADGATSPLSFGSVQRDAKVPTRTFRVRNDGNAPLTIGGVSVPAGFAVIDKLVGPIAPGSMESFTVSLDTRAPGNRGGTVAIANNDANESPFNFAVSGAVAAPPGRGPAVTAALSGGTLTVNGTSTIDTIELALSSAGVSVVGNGRTISGSPFNGVKRIVVNGNDGDDRIDAARVSIPVTINGGNGNDTLVGGSGADNLSGGNGNDALFGGPGIDLFHGDEGADTLTATDGLADGLVDGGGGNDTIRKDRVDSATGT